MKKVFILSILVLFLSSLFALESSPSEVVGFVKLDAAASPSNATYSMFSLPFTFYDATHTQTMDLDDVVGDQLTAGNLFTADRIIEIGGNDAYLATGTPPTWTGSLVDFTINKGYYFKVLAGHSAQDVYVAGAVENFAQTMPNCPALPSAISYTLVAFVEAGNVVLDDIGLIGTGFQSGNLFTADRIIEIGGNDAYHDGTSWQGALTHLSPGKCYYIKILSGHTGVTGWIYNPTGADDSTIVGKITNNSNIVIPSRVRNLSDTVPVKKNDFDKIIKRKVRK